jgi:ubiquinone/menaquinone biosynthesis C-methylase UbiE
VFTSLFLHELEESVRAMAVSEMARVVKPGGRVLIIDYYAGPLRLKGHLTRSASTLVERIAGGDHYRNWRAFLQTGGIAALAPVAGLSIEREKIVSGGNMALWLLELS